MHIVTYSLPHKESREYLMVSYFWKSMKSSNSRLFYGGCSHSLWRTGTTYVQLFHTESNHTELTAHIEKVFHFPPAVRVFKRRKILLQSCCHRGEEEKSTLPCAWGLTSQVKKLSCPDRTWSMEAWQLTIFQAMELDCFFLLTSLWILICSKVLFGVTDWCDNAR